MPKSLTDSLRPLGRRPWPACWNCANCWKGFLPPPPPPPPMLV